MFYGTPYCTCGINYEGFIDSDNIVRIEEDVQTEQDCRRLCTLDRSCLLYTYYNEGHVTDEKLCIFLNEMHNPVQTCENCQTGAAICEPFNECTVAVLDGGDNISMSKLFVSESKTITFASGEDGCSKTVNGVTVGSGGNGGICGNCGGGGGSGFINATEFVIFANLNIDAEITVHEDSTTLKISDSGEVLLIAQNGYFDDGHGCSID